MSLSRRFILIALCLLACIGAGAFVLWTHASQQTVRDFSTFPYSIQSFDKLILTQSGQSFEIERVPLSQGGGTWQITSPIRASLSDWGLSVVEHLSRTPAIYVDMREPAQWVGSDEDPRRLPDGARVEATFLREGKVIANLTFGRGKREATANAERRWIFVEGDDSAYRVFTPLYDFGTPFLAPMRSWRNTLLLALDAHQIRAIHTRTARDEITLDRKGEANETNPQGWRVAEYSGTDIPQEALAHFRMDDRRVATILDLISPLYVDDYADGVMWSSIAPNGPAASIDIQLEDTTQTLEIGPEIDPKLWPAFAVFGEGARFAHMKGDETTTILTARRLLGIMPSLNDLRDKKIWQLRTDTLSAIEITVRDKTIRYRPSSTSSQSWQGECDGHVSEVRINGLIALVKGVSGLEALRYATAEETGIALEDASIRIYQNGEAEPAHILRMSAPQKNLFRFAKADDGPLFAISEGIADMILSDIRESNGP